MSKKKIKQIIIWGLVTVLSVVGASWYALSFNDGRLVYPMDFSVYSFQMKDLPMIAAIGLVMLYIIYLIWIIICYSMMERRSWKGQYPGRTRKINPKLGYLGFLGFAGFLGIATYIHDGSIFPFCFFGFFGFFGFFYEGRMSNVLADERFMENRREAGRKATALGFRLTYLLLILTGIFGNGRWLNVIAIVLMSGISLICGLVLFLGEYLLYRYDMMDSEEWRSEED